jgi:hypothetical protein
LTAREKNAGGDHPLPYLFAFVAIGLFFSLILSELTMHRVLSSRVHALTDWAADSSDASAGRKLLAFVVWPFSIVMAMRPQREREAARIASEFHSGKLEPKPADD